MRHLQRCHDATPQRNLATQTAAGLGKGGEGRRRGEERGLITDNTITTWSAQYTWRVLVAFWRGPPG